MQTAPERLRLKDGKLTLEDGNPADDYLREWAKDRVTEDTPLTLMTSKSCNELLFYRLLTLAA